MKFLTFALSLGLLSTQIHAESDLNAANRATHKAQKLSVEHQLPAPNHPQAKATTTEYAILIGWLALFVPNVSGTATQ